MSVCDWGCEIIWTEHILYKRIYMYISMYVLWCCDAWNWNTVQVIPLQYGSVAHGRRILNDALSLYVHLWHLMPVHSLCVLSCFSFFPFSVSLPPSPVLSMYSLTFSHFPPPCVYLVGVGVLVWTCMHVCESIMCACVHNSCDSQEWNEVVV